MPLGAFYQDAVPGHTALGLGGTEPHGGKGGFDGIGGAQIKPVLRRKVIAGQQFFPVLFQAVGRLGLLGPVHFQ